MTIKRKTMGDNAAMTERSRQRSPLAMTVLAFLAEAPMHAYRMHELIKQRGKDSVVNVAQRNSVYQTIARLLRTDLIRVQQTLQDEGRPERVVYEITEQGSQTLSRWLKDMLAEPGNEFPEFPAALAFLPVLAPKDVSRQLQQRVATLETRLAEAQASVKQAMEHGLPRLFLIEEDYKITMIRTELGWVRKLVAELDAKELNWNAQWLRKVAAELEPGG
jgi:DNA-binding PadR family transcriptional regulator